MPYIDAHLFNKTSVRKALTLELEEGEGITECIKKGMQDNNLELVKVESIEGKVSEALINYFERNQFKSSVIKDKEILKASGSFKLNFGELFGQMKIVTLDKPPMHGTFVRGKASEGLKIRLSFMELVENGKANVGDRE